MFAAGWILFAFVSIWVIPPTIGFLRRSLSRAASPPDDPPAVTVIVAARNEADHVEAALRSLLASEDIELQLIAVNDRSTDATGEIMDRIARDDARLQVVHVDHLPEGWLGKTHAMHVAAGHATADLIVFTDGDVVFQPNGLSTACLYADREQLDHLCLLPEMIPGKYMENACLAFFGLAYAIGLQVHMIRTRWWPFSYAGVGAFNLVRRSFYEQVGGHRPIAMDVVDDVKLGKLIRREGGRVDFLRAPDLMSVRWQPSLYGMITGLEKNAFASLNYSVVMVLLCSVAFLLTMICPYVVPFWTDLETASGFLATILVWHSAYGSIASIMPGGWKLIPMFPVAASIMSFAWWRSAWITLRQGGVRW